MQLLQEKGVHPSAPKTMQGGTESWEPRGCPPPQAVLTHSGRSWVPFGPSPAAQGQSGCCQIFGTDFRLRLVGTSWGRLGSAGAPGRGSDWEMQEAGLVSLSGVQIFGRFRSLGAVEPAPVSLKNQKRTKKQRGAGRKEIRKAKNKAKSSSCGVDRCGKWVRLVPLAVVPGGAWQPQPGQGGGGAR